MNHKTTIIIILLVISLLASLLILKITYQQKIDKINQEKQLMITGYTEEIKNETNPNILIESGLKQLENGQPELAMISLKKAVTVEPNFRDGWLTLGLAQYTQKDYQAALTSFLAAEKIDPINAQTYHFLNLTYTKLKQKDLALIAQEKFVFLNKNQK
ncbi:MAG: hypothetical protein WCP93_00965 [Candidatus Berkelbacteria bacterium]